MYNDSKKRYGVISRLFHWGMAILIFWQGLKFFDRINDGEHWVGQTLVSWHVSIGTLLLVLVILRIIWAVKQKDSRPDQDPATVLLVKAGHGLLYLGMFLLPVTGLMILIGNGYPLKVFGIQLLAGGTEIGWMASLGGALHSPAAWLLFLVIFGHAGVALLHHFVKRDDVLKRML